MIHTPDSWVLIELNPSNGRKFYKVLAGWSGSYLNGDSWRLNSGITSVEEDGDYWLFNGESGSQYKCNKSSNRVSNSFSHIIERLNHLFPTQIKVMPKETDITSIKW